MKFRLRKRTRNVIKNIDQLGENILRLEIWRHNVFLIVMNLIEGLDEICYVFRIHLVPLFKEHSFTRWQRYSCNFTKPNKVEY